MMNNFFKNKLKESLLQHRVPYDEQSWQIVANQLDAQQSKQKLISAWWLLLLLPLVGWNYALQVNLKHQLLASPSQPTMEQGPKVIRDTVYQVVYRNVYIKENQAPPIVAETRLTRSEEHFSKNASQEDLVDALAPVQPFETAGAARSKDIYSGTNNNGLSSTEPMVESATDLLFKGLHKIADLKTDEPSLEGLEANQDDRLSIKPVQKRTLRHAFHFESVRLSGQQTVPLVPINEKTYAATFGYSIAPSLTMSTGLQYHNASNAIAKEELELHHHAPVPHQGGDVLLDVVYQSAHWSIPINLEYYFNTKSRYKTFVTLGSLFQHHLNTKLLYNIQTANQEAYLIEKKIVDRHWNTFLTFGVGLDFPLYQKIKGFASLSIRKSIEERYLLSNEKVLSNVAFGIKYKF